MWYWGTLFCDAGRVQLPASNSTFKADLLGRPAKATSKADLHGRPFGLTFQVDLQGRPMAMAATLPKYVCNIFVIAIGFYFWHNLYILFLFFWGWYGWSDFGRFWGRPGPPRTEFVVGFVVFCSEFVVRSCGPPLWSAKKLKLNF